MSKFSIAIKNIDKRKIIKYLLTSGISFLIDIILFSIFNSLFKIESIFLATIYARIISSLYNYYVNSRFVFKNYSKLSILKYYLLVIIQMFISAFSTNIISNLLKEINPPLIKLFVDFLIFINNYFIQKNLIFIKRDN